VQFFAVLRIRTRFNMDSDPVFKSMCIQIWIRIQGFDDQKLKKITGEKKNIFFKSRKLLIPLGLRKGRRNYWRSLHLIKEHSALQNMKFLYFFLLLWVIYALLDPDQHFQCGSESSRPKSMRIQIRNTVFLYVSNSESGFTMRIR
jgi:hypothetical protein